MPRWFLELSSGVQVNLGRGLTSVGRSTRCDIVVPDPSVSRKQALLCPRVEGLEMINVGKQPLTIDGEPLTGTGLAGDGASIAIADVPFAVVRRGQASLEPPARAQFCLRVNGGPLISLPSHPFTIGGTGQDDLLISTWNHAALVFHPVGEAVIVEASPSVAGAIHADFDEDGFARVVSGQRLDVEGVEIEVVMAESPDLEQSTEQLDTGSVVKLERLGSGGLLTLERGGGETVSLHLAPRRYALIRALLAPTVVSPTGHYHVNDLCRMIWPEDPLKDWTDFNVLLHRVRRDLVNAGLDVEAWIERKRGSGMVRAPIASAPDVEIRVES